MAFRTILGAAAISVAAIASSASAATINFNVGTGWNSGDVVFGNGTEFVTANAATHSNGGNLNFSAYLASWSGGSGGAGVCSDWDGPNRTSVNSNSTGYCDESHTVDSDGPDELVTLDFGSMLVELVSITFAYVNRNDDFNVYSYGSGFSDLLLSSEERTLPNNCGTCTTTNFSSLTGSLFGIGVGGSGDTVKLQAISFNVLPPPPPPPAIPLPAAGWMLLAGLGGMAAIGRRRRNA